MAKSRTTESGYTNPEVRFERTDIEVGRVVTLLLILGAILAGSMVLAQALAWRLTRGERAAKESTLPRAAGDRPPKSNLPLPASAVPPEPRLEAIDDLRDTDRRNLTLFPARAAEDSRRQVEMKPGDGTEPVADAIGQLAGKLPARKGGPPATFSLVRPGSASSGRVMTGGPVK